MVSVASPSATLNAGDPVVPAARADGRLSVNDRPLLRWSLERRHPLFLVTPSLHLLDMNLAAAALGDTDAEIQIAGGQFSFNDKARTAELRDFLETGEGEAGGWSYQRSDGDVVVVYVEWLRAPKADRDGSEPLVALTFCPAALEHRYVWADFAPRFDLTRSEAAIVRKLIGGNTPSEVAAELGASIETVRTHIRRTYNKLGISSREQLFSLIAPFRIG